MRIELDEVSCSYGRRQVLQEITATIPPGSITVLLGPNAAGKTTLMRCVAGLLGHTGTIIFDGRDTSSWSAQERAGHVSYVAQDTALRAALSVFEIVLLGRIHSLRWSVAAEHIDAAWAALSDVGAAHLAAEPVTQLSGGQRQLVAIAQALVRQPEVLLLDEPISSLDLRNQFEILELVGDLTRRRHIATVISLHHLDLAARYADEVVVLRDGRVHACGAPADVITEKLVGDVYGVRARVDSMDGVLRVTPLGTLRARSPSAPASPAPSSDDAEDMARCPR